MVNSVNYINTVLVPFFSKLTKAGKQYPYFHHDHQHDNATTHTPEYFIEAFVKFLVKG
jgi:thiamine phosphate synthase YjbQ (UPF0047 family)